MIKKLKDIRIGRRVTVVRSKLHLGQGAFGRLLGVTRSAVSAWERGCGISARMLDKICASFDISPDWLWCGMGGMWRAIAVQNEPWRPRGCLASSERASSAWAKHDWGTWNVTPLPPLPGWKPAPRVMTKWSDWKLRVSFKASKFIVLLVDEKEPKK